MLASPTPALALQLGTAEKRGFHSSWRLPPHLGSPSGPQYGEVTFSRLWGGGPQALAGIFPSHASPYLALGFGRIPASFVGGRHGDDTLSSWKGAERVCEEGPPGSPRPHPQPQPHPGIAHLE